jgi:hypothetical protein
MRVDMGGTLISTGFRREEAFFTSHFGAFGTGHEFSTAPAPIMGFHLAFC